MSLYDDAMTSVFSSIIACCCSYCWLDDDTIIANAVVEGRGPPPPRPLAPIGPKIQDNSEGRRSQARTYQDLLQDTHDEDLFDYYTTSQLLSIQVRGPSPGATCWQSMPPGFGSRVCSWITHCSTQHACLLRADSLRSMAGLTSKGSSGLPGKKKSLCRSFQGCIHVCTLCEMTATRGVDLWSAGVDGCSDPSRSAPSVC